MTTVRKLSEQGTSMFKAWLNDPLRGSLPPSLVNGDIETEEFCEVTLDPDKKFDSRYEFGQYLTERFAAYDFYKLMAPDADAMWAWICVLYFSQLAPTKISRAEHYIVTRAGHRGSLAYRNAARTSYELVRIHGALAQICLAVPMKTFGEMAEQLASRQTVAHNKGFFQAAYQLYIRDSKLRKGATSKPKKAKDRKDGDKTGFGGVRRLAVALQRLDLTYDTEEMGAPQLVPVLPKEFGKWTTATAAS